MTDEQLMARVKSGELHHLNEIYSRFGKQLFNYFLKSTLQRSDSDDLTQELFIRVMKYRKSYKEGQKLQYWLFQIARNMLKDHFSKMKIHRDQYEWVEQLPESVEEGDDTHIKEQRLYRAMACLQEEKRELLVLSKFQGMKYQQIADMRNMTVSNVKVQVHRSIKELKEHYFKMEDDA